ncbi:Hypothetical protein A7982_06562 [Minicystis rosea]|nr:Hypothetical protein A7982_06562 [Minicystis rosea]
MGSDALAPGASNHPSSNVSFAVRRPKLMSGSFGLARRTGGVTPAVLHEAQSGVPGAAEEAGSISKSDRHEGQATLIDAVDFRPCTGPAQRGEHEYDRGPSCCHQGRGPIESHSR